MPLTPADIHNTAFKKPPIGKRGYDEEEVDAFLDEVEQEPIRLLEENAAGSDAARRKRRGAGVGVGAKRRVCRADGAVERTQEARARVTRAASQDQLSAPATPRSPVRIASAGDDDRNAGF